MLLCKALTSGTLGDNFEMQTAACSNLWQKQRMWFCWRKEGLISIHRSTNTSKLPLHSFPVLCGQQYTNSSFSSKISSWLPSLDNFLHLQPHASNTESTKTFESVFLNLPCQKAPPCSEYGPPSHKCLPPILTYKCSYLNICLTRVLAFLVKAERREAL